MNGILNISGKTNVWDALIMQLIDKNELSINQWHKFEAPFLTISTVQVIQNPLRFWIDDSTTELT